MFHFVITLSDAIGFGIILFILISFVICASIELIINTYKSKSKKYHNCFKCKNYILSDVAGAGDRCWYRCKYKQEEDSYSMNDNVHYEKCSKYEEEK